MSDYQTTDEREPWLRDGTLVYCLIEDDRPWNRRRMVNRMTVKVEACRGCDNADAAALAERIQRFLNGEADHG